jgi:tetratricopeptide (TPR) repeat protein
MMADRLTQLQALLAEEPGDPFLRYAIALERKRSGDMETAAGDLESLLQENPKYIACYYQLALVLADLGRLADAAEACKAGALQCLVTGDAKARAELLALGAQLMAED